MRLRRLRGTARRTMIDRWIISLRPLNKIIASSMATLNLGQPRVQLGPTYLDRVTDEVGGIRHGAVWFVNGVNTGFHVDFVEAGSVRIKAWCSEREVLLTTHGKVTEASLTRDLNAAFVAAGLPQLSELDAKREDVMSRSGVRVRSRRSSGSPS